MMVNPLYPPVLGEFKRIGDTPRTLAGEKSPAPLFIGGPKILLPQGLHGYIE
jgi:hypothetical protein